VTVSTSHLLSPDGQAVPVRPEGSRWRLREVEKLVGGRVALIDVSPLGNVDTVFDRLCKRWTVVAAVPTPEQPLNLRASNIVGRPIFGPAVLTPSRMLD